jgi:Pentapeptide repeats (8 copies)
LNTHFVPPRPVPWTELKARAPHPALLPLFAFDWGWQWLAWLLGNWSFLLVLEYLGSFSVLIAVIFWFSESGDRVKQRHYQAWQVINTAQGQSGSGGRIDALQELNADHVALTGVAAVSAFLQGIRLPHAKLARADFSSADLRNSDLHNADLTWANLHYANLRDTNLESVAFDHANLSDCDFSGSDLAGAHLEYASLMNADLRHANLHDIDWQHIDSVVGADLDGVTNAPPGFVAWALQNGALQSHP